MRVHVCTVVCVLECVNTSVSVCVLCVHTSVSVCVLCVGAKMICVCGAALEEQLLIN